MQKRSTFTLFFITTLVFITAIFSACSKEENSVSEVKNTSVNNSGPIHYQKVDWTDLIPDEDLKALENPPDYLAEILDGSEEDMLANQLKSRNTETKDRYQQALNSKEVRPEFDERNIRIPGFIVPLEFDDQQTITTFFLVPFFGACIHSPPPPPNQIIYSEYEPGIKLDALYYPFWIEGTLSTTLMENDMATAAYSMTVATIHPYEEEAPLPPEDSKENM